MDKIKNTFAAPAVWSSLYGLGACLHVTGSDALSFLQGQFTQELRSNAAGLAAYGLWLNQKGKVLADSYILRESPESAWVISVFGNATIIRERLDAYVIADDVVISDVTSDWQAVVVGGVEAESWVKRTAGAIPSPGEFVRAGGGFLFRGRRSADPCFEWLLPVRVSLAEMPLVCAAELERARIVAGIPKVPQDIGPGDLPNEGGLDEVAISYTKGCYLGQEVMARLKAMGTVRRCLVRVRAGGRGLPAVPCALLQGEKRVGELRSVADDGSGGFVGLAMVTKLGLDPHALLAPEPGGAGFIELVDLP
jgi:folate-binding protein YgfZ